MEHKRELRVYRLGKFRYSFDEIIERLGKRVKDIQGDFLCLFLGGLCVVISVFSLILGIAFDIMSYAVFVHTVFFVLAVMCFVLAYCYKSEELKNIEEKRVRVEERRRHIIEVWKFYTNLFDKDSNTDLQKLQKETKNCCRGGI